MATEIVEWPDDVGVAGRELRLWGVKEAIKHAQCGLAEQDKVLESAIRTATAILGWSVTLATAMIAALASAKLTAAQLHAVWVALGFTLIAAWASAYVLMPRRWSMSHADPADLQRETYAPEPGADTELDVLGPIAKGLALGLAANMRVARWRAVSVNVATAALALMPIAAAMTYFVC